MSNPEFQVIDVRNGTPKQRQFGIMANFNLNVKVDGVIVLRLRDLKIQKGSKGTFISSPSRKYTNKDGQDSYINFIDIFPEDRTGSWQKAMMEQVRREIDNTPSKPQPQPKPQPANTDEW